MAEFMKHIVALLLLLIASIGIANCARQKSPLLIEDEGNRRNRPAECHFGKELKELGSTWFPDLGAPFGKMYCIKCECVPVQKKRRIVARVQCRNIKNECPKPTCDEPILLPGRCCKTCPGDSFSPDIVQDTPMNMTEIEEDRNVKHFGAVLTGRTSVMLKRDGLTYSTQNPQNIAATGRFSFHKRNLYYSFYISEKAVRPRAIQFIDATGNILEEHSLVIPNNGPNSMYQNATGKICGVWRRVPKDYRRMLREDQINVVLIWGGKTQSELALAGPISKYPALSTELFSALLEPSPGTNSHSMAGSGGTAIVSTSSGATSSIHLTLVLNGLFSSDETSDVPLNIRLESVEKRQIIIEDVQRVKKPSYDINVIEVSSPVSVYDLRMLTRGKLQIIVESRKNPEALRIQGNVVTRVSCEIFQTLLYSHNPESKTKADGIAWAYLDKYGSLVYNIQTHNLNIIENPLITLISENGGGKKNTELEDLTSSLQSDHAYGVVDRLGPRVLEPLYSGNLGINIATKSETSLIRGRFVSRPVTDSRDSPEPVLLKRVGDHVPMHSVGMAWIAVDNDCNLHYDISVTGLTPQFYPLQAYLLDMPMEVYGAPVNRRLLEEFSGNHLEGFLLSISQTDLAKLESSVNFLEIVSKDNHNLLKTKLKPIKVPNLCYPIDPDNDDIFKTPRDNADQASNDSKCFYANRFYDDGEQWHSTIESCTVCACNNRRVKCDTIKCPPLKCKKEDQQHRKGECCPTCPDGKHSDEVNNTLPRGCKLGEQFYKAGSSWHPYLPPNGFDTCAVCTCDALTLEVSCPRTTCPPLNCSEKVAYRQDKKACCKRCPDVKVPRVTAVNTEEMKDQGSRHGGVNSPTVIMATGGCKSPMGYHPNGADWHPVIASHGEQKCIKCKCKDGNINCEKKRCPRSVCQNQKNNSKKQPLEDECCQCRARRPQNGQRRRQKQQEKSQNNLTKS